MQWFDEQIRQRIRRDDDAFSDAFADVASVVTGINLSGAQSKDALDEILQYYHAAPQELPESITDINEQLEYLTRPSGIMRRTVFLTGKWYKDAVGAMLGSKKDGGETIALIPGALGYSYRDPATGKRVRVDKKAAANISEEAICFYRPLPTKKLGIVDLVMYIMHTVPVTARIKVSAITLAVALVGLLIPRINNLIYSLVITQNSNRLLIAVFGFLLGVSFSQLLISVAKSMATDAIGTRMRMQVQAAGMMRVMSLPARFFQQYASGDLSSRISHLESICSIVTNSVLTSGLTSVFSLIYIFQMLKYGPALVVPGMTVIILTVVFSAATALMELKISKKSMELSAKEEGLNYALITGVQKIKLAGAEKRAFARWAKAYRGIAKLEYDPPTLIKLKNVITTCVSLVGSIVIYFFTIRSNVRLADYYAFISAYAMVMGAFSTLVGAATSFARIKPMLDMVRPILEEVPEISEKKQVVTRLSGGIELSNVTFSYGEGMPVIIDDLSIKIRPGQYVAIVGATGCGKSTLMRLMLGFETPQKGAVYFDGRDLATLDLKSLRRNIGSVMQNGKLFQGDIYSNITISAPWLDMNAAWEAADLAGIAEDIRNMPMGMQTIISEGSGGVSGGQRQRLMIARAIAPKPKILMFDEATSALDNITQRHVSEALDRLKCTRIVIAHRLSTIRQCDRIIVLDKGRIAEDGKYDELIASNGMFASLVARQRLDSTEYVGKTTLY